MLGGIEVTYHVKKQKFQQVIHVTLNKRAKMFLID